MAYVAAPHYTLHARVLVVIQGIKSGRTVQLQSLCNFDEGKQLEKTTMLKEHPRKQLIFRKEELTIELNHEWTVKMTDDLLDMQQMIEPQWQGGIVLHRIHLLPNSTISLINQYLLVCCKENIFTSLTDWKNAKHHPCQPYVSRPSSIPGSDSNKAFTGSIVEHAHDIGINSAEHQTGARNLKMTLLGSLLSPWLLREE
ncbi:Uncharacterized protein Fot_12307 [Forsythia ovata]|uniref:Uncharacterized protein n=1 Tax=Forsythia ovata TaxID=205694 RepID=A0ABD1WMC1_9LAMI